MKVNHIRGNQAPRRKKKGVQVARDRRHWKQTSESGMPVLT